MAAHACLKNEFTEDEKCHNLMRWLKYFLVFELLEGLPFLHILAAILEKGCEFHAEWNKVLSCVDHA